MKKLLILGAGTAGTMMLNKLDKRIDKEEWDITIIDKDNTHYYQPGFLFIPFGIYQPSDVVKTRKEFFPKGTNFIMDEVEEINAADKEVILKSGKELSYDLLVIATGTKPVPSETEGLDGPLWYKDIFDFYTFEGATLLAKKLRDWKGGKLVINLAETIIKCPVAPLEFAFLADAYFTEKGIRDKVDIQYVTPLSGAFTKPIATKMLSQLMEEKNIHVVPDFYIEHVDNENKKIVSYDGLEVDFDLLVSIPTNMGSEMVENSNMSDEDDLNFIPTNKHTLQHKEHENIFVIGDATNLPTSKAGSVAHFEGEILIENILDFMNNKPLSANFDGHANCFIETGFGKAALIDFNYTTEPLPGQFPIPILGPMGLLKETRINHMGKLAFKWVYWHMLLTGKSLPVSTNMSMSGKKAPKKEENKEKEEPQQEEVLL
ncbi:sulfide:quinone oxidoreductase [Marivirga sericea]|uniref:Sulfide:quinone oxidoreductase n=1 Tax=Marivirga sericea TaxID=1028 RepID=A0A1X7IF42_9BACT|nr:FAD/NAD(P)-binding oxidoreductase [Marivirga sericea]SMG13328.1 sulfide:quinone oxidoreductase [Marivirga sericea]